MIKRLLAASALAAATLVTLSARSSSGGPPEPEAYCYGIDFVGAGWHRPLDLTYSARQGALLRLQASAELVTAVLPLEIDGDPNPHFDRMYALMMKGFDDRRLEQVCVARRPTAGEPVDVVSVSLRHVEPPAPPALQKVQVCDAGSSCAWITSGRIWVRPD